MKQIIAIILLVTCLQSCEFFRKSQQTSDSKADVKKETIEAKSGDTSRTTTNSKNEWERWTFAPRDTSTNVFNINIPKQTYPSPVIYERGSGSETKQVDMGQFYNMQRAFLDSIAATKTTEKTETKASVFSPMVIVALALLVFFVLIFAVLILYIFSKLKNKITL